MSHESTDFNVFLKSRVICQVTLRSLLDVQSHKSFFSYKIELLCSARKKVHETYLAPLMILLNETSCVIFKLSWTLMQFSFQKTIGKAKSNTHQKAIKHFFSVPNGFWDSICDKWLLKIIAQSKWKRKTMTQTCNSSRQNKSQGSVETRYIRHQKSSTYQSWPRCWRVHFW